MPIHETDTAIRMSRVLRAAQATVFEGLIRPELLQRIELSAQGEHTFLLMTPFGLPTEDGRTSHQSGWTSALNQLERLFEPRSTP